MIQKQIQVAYTISEVNDNIIISSAQSIDELFKSYTGQVTKQEVLNKINEFIANIEDLRLNSTLKTENEKRQYFDLNKSTLENIGITSQDDYISITNQINVMKWKESDLQYEKYEVNSESAVNEEDYVSFELVIYYNYNCSLDLKVSLSNQKSITPNIKISSYKYENKVDDN